MAKVLVLYYSSYGHIETMANAMAEGARAAGAQVDVKRIPATVPEVVGGAPYGATTITGGDGSRQPSETELAGARHQGELIAKTATKLFG
ncbi:flavodoxin domain-containing protein [Azotobacter chroococcum]|uniref:Flavodoxin-like domain-containing protein n=1 Tax=Azotobacter chroococcum TaxID=353 RepID=A0AAQ0BWW3_9GAMM|nr:flavodoxin domain-containing protein [Azotobacter chroococcum]QQE86892.1 hypothetical protein GKQ51_11090 [Azotobacter chroococcum]